MGPNHAISPSAEWWGDAATRLRGWLIALALIVAAPALAAPPDAVTKARQLLADGQMASAAAILEEWLAEHPKDVEAAVLLADAYLVREPAKAGDTLARVLRRTGDRPELLERLVQAEQRANRAERLVDALVRLRALRPDDPEPSLQLADAYDRADRPSESAAALDAYLALRPEDAAAWQRLAERRERLGNVVDAVRAREAIKVLLPRDPANLRALGDLYIRLGRNPEAVTAYEAARNLTPKHVPTLKRLAQLYGWNDMPKRRIATLQELRTLAPYDTDARRDLADAYADIERYDLAAVELDAVVLRRPNDAPTRIAAARYHIWGNDEAAALTHLETVLDRDPQNALARRLMADLLRDRGDKLEALYHYKQLQNEGQTDKTADEAIMELELETRPRIAAQYEFYVDRNGQEAHQASIWYERSSSDIWRYRTGYRFSYNEGVSLQNPQEGLELFGHGGFIGSTFRLATRSYLDAEVWVTAIDDVDPFVGMRVGWIQQARFPFEFRLFFDRRQDMSTIDALFYDTVVYGLNAELKVEPVDRWIVEAELGYGRWINDSVIDGTRQFNNGYTWRIGTGVRVLEDPVTLEIVPDYDGIAFENFDPTLPYFAPESYQRLGVTVYLQHKPHWRFEYSLFARPNWVVEDDAMQIVYGGDMKVFVARRHWFELAFARTDTPVGTTNVVYRENVVRFTWISVF